MEYKPGVYRNMPSDEYFRIPYMSASLLKIGQSVSMRHMREYQRGNWEYKDTASKRFGRAFHCWLLEPAKFSEAYAIASQCTARKQDGSTCSNGGTKLKDGKWDCGVHGKGLPDAANMISDHDLFEIEGAGKSLREKEIANVLRQPGSAELTVIAEIEGMMCKGRFDYYALTTPPTIVDIKKITVGRGSEKDLQKSIREYLYDLQAALYLHLHYAVFGTKAQFLWMFVEQSKPHEVIPRFASRDMVSVGWAKASRTIHHWKECVERNEWPGYVTEPCEIDPEAWETKRYGL
jgi:exodeoxyribonuclease VIII